MNHTIVTLDERAKDYAAMELATVNPGGIEEFNRLYRNKFAELIVRECVTTIETYNNNSLTKKIADEGVYSYEQGAIAGMNESVLVIKQHFGIEE